MKVERRTIGELRASEGAEPALSGTACSFNVLSSDLGGYREVVQPGAFNQSLSSGDDVVCLLNHDPSKILGRRSAGTLRVWEDQKGLQFRCSLDPENSDHMNLRSSIKRGDIHQCSFAFTVADGGDAFDSATDENGQRFARRTLRNVKLHDVSSVTHPAYPGAATNVSARSAETSDWAAQMRAKLDNTIADSELRSRLHAIEMQIAKEKK